MHAINNNAIVSGAVWGGAGLLLFFFPLFYYVKRFYFDSGQDGKSFFEIIATAFATQIIMVSVLSMAAYFSNHLLSAGTSYDARDGIRLFYTGSTTSTSAVNLKLWEIWKPIAEKAEKTTGGVSGDGQIKRGTAVMIYYLSVFLYFTLLGISFSILIFPVFYILRKSRNNPQQFSLSQKVGGGMLLFFGLIAVVYVHEMIASGYIAACGELSNFSFYKMLQAAWGEIFIS